MFDSMATLCVAQSPSDLYRMVLVDTPLGPYFGDCLSLEDIDEMNIEIIRNTLFKAYLEDFHSFCRKIGGATAEVMGGILELEADRRAINITVNSIDTDLDLKQREKLYPTIGLLFPYAAHAAHSARSIPRRGRSAAQPMHPTSPPFFRPGPICHPRVLALAPPSRRDREGTSRLAKATDVDAVRGAIDAYHDYRCFYPPHPLPGGYPLCVGGHAPSFLSFRPGAC